METNEIQEYSKQLGQIVAKAWADEDFKQQFLADPAATLLAEGLTVPPGVELRAVENTSSVVYLTLPPKPNEELSDEQLSQVAGGSTSSTAASGGSFGCLSCPASCISSAATLGSVGSAG